MTEILIAGIVPVGILVWVGLVELRDHLKLGKRQPNYTHSPDSGIYTTQEQYNRYQGGSYESRNP